jgi:hypothetical protein
LPRACLRDLPQIRHAFFEHFRIAGNPALRIGGEMYPRIVGFVQFGAATMKTLITDEQRAQLLANGRARAEGQALDPLPVVKLFTPDAHATWLLTELDPEDGDTAYGLRDLGLGMPELDTVRLSELVSIRGPLRRLIERDLYFVAQRTLSEYARLAQINGSIID